MKNEIEYSTRRNSTKEYDKPNEDYFICDDKKAIFIVADGVTRDLEQGIYPNPSPSAAVSKLFCNTVHHILSDELSTRSFQEAAFNAAVEANNAIREFNVTVNKGRNGYAASAVAVIANINEETLAVTYNGDCGCVIIRQGILQTITPSQTKGLLENRNGLTRHQIRKEIANNKNHPQAYGVFDGDERAKDFITGTTFNLEDDDVIILYSDGCEYVLENTDPADLRSFSPEEIITRAEELEKLHRFRSDDKTIIKIKVRS